MKTIRRSRFFRCIVLPLALLAVLPACFKWEPLNGPVDRSITYGRPEQVRVILADGTLVEMKSPWIQGDSIIGLDPKFDKRTRTRDTLVVRLSDVTSIKQRESDKVANTALYLGVSLGLTAAYALSEDGGGYWGSSN